MEKILMSFVFEHLDTIAVKIDVSFLCDCPAIDHEFRHSFENVKTKFIVNNRTGARKTQASIWFFAIISCRIIRSATSARCVKIAYVINSGVSLT